MSKNADFSDWLTLFADASFCPRTLAAGWGAWVKRDGLTTGEVFGDPLKYMETSQMAELAAIYEALRVCQERDWLKGIRIIMVQSDCEWALQRILALCARARQSPKGHRFNRVYVNAAGPHAKICWDIAGIVGADRQLLLRHVKGHNGGKEGRSWVNEQCDRIARGHMNARRKKLS